MMGKRKGSFWEPLYPNCSSTSLSSTTKNPRISLPTLTMTRRSPMRIAAECRRHRHRRNRPYQRCRRRCRRRQLQLQVQKRPLHIPSRDSEICWGRIVDRKSTARSMTTWRMMRLGDDVDSAMRRDSETPFRRRHYFDYHRHHHHLKYRRYRQSIRQNEDRSFPPSANLLSRPGQVRRWR